MNPPDLVRIDVDGAVVTLTLDRPAALNSLDHPMALALGRAVDDAGRVPGARAIVLRGAGRSFCGGGDVAAMHAHRDDLPGFIGRMIDAFHATIVAMSRSRLPLIASVHGAVAGGGISLALACDLVVAARGTRFVVAYPQLGAPADGGLSFRLTQQLGAARAFERLTLHGSFDAAEAASLGLVNRVVDDDTAHAEAARWARQLGELPQQSVDELKPLVKLQSLDALQAQLDREKAAFLRCAATPDFAARVAAFAEKSRQRAAPPKDAP